MEQTIINTFEKGLNQDVDFILQPDGTYRNMKNGMLISHDGHHYTIEISKGNKVILDLPSRYHSNNSNSTDLDKVPMPIGFISFIDKLVVFHTNKESSTGGYGEIGVITFSKVGNDFTSSYVPYYHHPNINFTKYHKIEGFSFKENDNVERVYWTDDYNEPRVFDIANPIFTNYISSGSLIDGKQYMVLQGVIDYNGDYYGPSDDSSTAIEASPYVNSNIFTANATTTFSTIQGSPLVIEYYPLELLNWNPSRSLGNINFSQYGSGNVYCGGKMYFYRLINQTIGVRTTWSYGSNIVPVEKYFSGQSSLPGTNNYHDWSGAGTSSTLENSLLSVKVNINNIDLNFEFLELACAEFDQSYTTPRQITIVNRVAITSNDMEVEHSGNLNLGTLTLNDVTLFPANILKVKTLASNKNYLIVGNISERNEFDNEITATIGSVVYPMIAHGSLGVCTNNFTYGMLNPSTSANPTDIEPYSRYAVTDITGGDVTYNAVTYTIGQVITGVAGVTAITIPAGSQIRPCTTINRYDVSNPLASNVGDRVDNYVLLKQGWWDYKDPANASHVKGYWSDEKYRIGILFFDKKGNPFYVRHLGDYSFPNISDKGGIIDNATGTEVSYHVRPSLLKIDDLSIPEEVMNEISGFSIVRAERDARILTQGLVMQTITETTLIRPIASMRVSESERTSTSTFLTYLCPDEQSIDYTFKKTFGEVGDKVEEACWLEPEFYDVNVALNSDLATGATVCKLFDHLTHDSGNSAERLETIEKVNNLIMPSVNEDGTFTDGLLFHNRSVTHAITSPLTSTFCLGGGNVALVDSESVGGKKNVFKVSNMFKSYGVADLYNTTNSSFPKILMNYVKPIDPSAQYGGDSTIAIANTLYISTGHYQPITAQVLEDTDQGDGTYLFTNIEVGGGDCFVNIVDYGYGLYTAATSFGISSNGIGIYFPCECNTNYNLRRGKTPSREGIYPGHANGLAWDNGSGTILEDYQYNQGYSAEGQLLLYPGLPLNFKTTNNFESRTRWSEQKVSGEIYDSFRSFLVNNFRDLDGQRGEINNLKSRDSKLFYWQNHSVGYLPILERQLVGGDALGEATALGVGGVIDRFDDIDTYFGNQHQHGLTETEYGFIWFDMRRRALVVMTTGGGVQEISLAKGLQVFFNNEFNEGEIFLSEGIYNTNNGDIAEIPLLGYGIVGVYDPRFKMSYLTFKYTKDTLVDEDDELVTVEAKDFTIGYSHVLNVIVGFYDFTPGIWHNHNDLVLSANNPKNRVYYGANMPETNFVVGDIVAINDDTLPSVNGEYVCIQNLTITAYPTDANKRPEYVGSVYWVKINEQSEIYLQTFNTDYCKFYGKVHDHELELIVNPKSDNAFSLMRIQQKSNDTNYTSVYCSTDNQSSHDLNIKSWNRNYRYIYTSWFSSIPLASNGRLTDNYTKVKFVLKNYVTNPTVARNVNKILQFVKSWFVIKK